MFEKWFSKNPRQSAIERCNGIADTQAPVRASGK
jgi:hypothetical protein